MRVLVVGSLPPPESARSLSLRSAVVALAAAGHSVEVVAPDPVATAHRYLVMTGIPGCIQLATLTKGFDSVLVQVQPGLPVRARAGRLERELSLRAFGLALRRAAHVVVRIEDPSDLPGGASGHAASLAWRCCERIELATEQLQQQFVAEAGQKVAPLVSCSGGAGVVDQLEDGWGEADELSREDVLGMVRSRSARERADLVGRGQAHLAGWDYIARPGIAIDQRDMVVAAPGAISTRPGDMARRLLALADRRPKLRYVARGARLARRAVLLVLRPDRSR